MNKKLLIALTCLAFTASTQYESKAEPTATLAIIDTGIDASFKSKVSYEVCILDWNTCPNGKNFMEGEGSAVVPSQFIGSNGFNHGTFMVSAALKANPELNIVFIRIIGNTAKGARQLTTASTLTNALNWVYLNKDKFNIQAVSMSQSQNNFLKGENYCPKMGTSKESVQKLLSSGVPSFFPAGNDRDYTHVSWPACIEESIAIGSTDLSGAIALYSNYDAKLIDFYENGSMQLLGPNNVVDNVAGTSAATQVAAAKWLKLKSSRPQISYTEAYNIFMKTAKPALNSKINAGNKLINLEGALNER